MRSETAIRKAHARLVDHFPEPGSPADTVTATLVGMIAALGWVLRETDATAAVEAALLDSNHESKSLWDRN
ncbi:MAG: hypothetical protein GY838_03795 [bacterium]|nr:hypothetical protein [bacterium]